MLLTSQRRARMDGQKGFVAHLHGQLVDKTFIKHPPLQEKCCRGRTTLLKTPNDRRQNEHGVVHAQNVMFCRCFYASVLGYAQRREEIINPLGQGIWQVSFRLETCNVTLTTAPTM